MSTSTMPYMIYAEVTPNPATMKFVANHNLALNGQVYEYTSEATASGSPLAQRLFSFPFIKSLFIAQNFVTISKIDGIEWDEVMLELREYISNFLNSGHEVFSETAKSSNNQAIASGSGLTDHAKADTPIEEQIVEILDDYIRPAVEGDGGAIHFKSYENGKLTVVLKGACSGCPSSTVTLKAGIQSLFERMLPEVKEVVAEEE